MPWTIEDFFNHSSDRQFMIKEEVEVLLQSLPPQEPPKYQRLSPNGQKYWPKSYKPDPCRSTNIESMALQHPYVSPTPSGMLRCTSSLSVASGGGDSTHLVTLQNLVTPYMQHN